MPDRVIGRSSALAFAQEGASVLVSDINPQGGEETVNLIQESKGKAHFFQCDVSQSAQVERLIENTIQTFGRLDYAVNAQIPMGHMGQSKNIADAVAWLCDNTSSFITGHVLVIDGGQTIR